MLVIGRLGILVGALLAALISATPAAAATQIVFGNDDQGLALGSGCIAGSAPASSTFHFVWRSSTGDLKLDQQVQTTAYGSWSACAPAGVVTQAGDRLKATLGATVRRFTLPLVTVFVDRVANVYRGEAPPNTSVTLEYSGGALSDYTPAVELDVDSGGQWSFNPGTFNSDPPSNVLGGAEGYATWQSAHGDTVSAYDIAPAVSVTVGRSSFLSTVHPGTVKTVFLRDGSTGTRKASSLTTDNVFRNKAGQTVRVAVHDRVTSTGMASDLDWIVPDSGATADVANDTINGFCEDTGWLSTTAVIFVHRTGHIRGLAWIATDPNGTFSVVFTGNASPGFDPANIKHGDRIEVRCMLNTGDWVSQSFLVP
jgi:hypothetical protein